MFYQSASDNPKSVDKLHVLPANSEVHPINSNGFPASQDLKIPPLNRFNLVRIKPKTTLQSNLFSPGQQTDFVINSSYTEKLLLQINFNVTTAAVTLNPEFLIERMEIISNGQIVSTIRGNHLHMQWLFKSYDQVVRECGAINKNASLVPQSIAVGNNYQITMHLWSLVDQITPKINAIKSEFTLKIYFTNVGIVAGTGTVSVTNCDVLCLTQQLSSVGESLESQKLQNRLVHYRFLNPIRACFETRALTPNSDYFFRLNSSKGAVAFIVFTVNLIGAAPDSYTAVQSYEFLDANNVIVGINIPGNVDTYVGNSFPGYGKTLFPNMYCIPFGFPTLAIQGKSSGNYWTSSLEQLHLYFGNISAGNHQIEITTWEFNVLHLEKGTLTLSK